MNAYGSRNRELYDVLVSQFSCPAMKLTLNRYAERLEFDNRDSFCTAYHLIQYLLEHEKRVLP